MDNDNIHVSDEIMHTYYANSRIPTDEELQALGIDPSRVYRITNMGTKTSFLGKIERIVSRILNREEE